jgi:hypothetical protein
MSTETFESIAVRVRRRFGGPESDVLKYQPLVDVALRALAYEVGSNPNLNNWLQTDRATTTVTLDAAGVADLTALIASPRIILECLPYGDIFPPAAYLNTQPFRLVENLGQLNLASAYDGVIFKACVTGFELFTKSADNNQTPLEGEISFSTTYWPTLAQLPDALVERLVMGPWWQEMARDKDAA